MKEKTDSLYDFIDCMEKTLQHLLYYHLVASPLFRKRFIEWLNLKGLGDPKLIKVTIERKSDSGLVHDLILESHERSRRATIELKVWSDLTKLQRKLHQKIDRFIVVDRNALQLPERSNDIKTWSELVGHPTLRKCVPGLKEFLVKGDSPSRNEIVSILKNWQARENSPQLLDLYLDKVWIYTGHLENWQADSRTYWSRADREFGFYFTHKRLKNCKFWVGFIWDESFRHVRVALMGEGDLSLFPARAKEQRPKWYFPEYAEIEKTKFVMLKTFPLNSADAQTVGRSVRNMLSKTK